MENISPSGEHKFGVGDGHGREVEPSLEADAEQGVPTELEMGQNVEAQAIVSLPPMVFDEELSDEDVVKNNIPDTAKDGERIEKVWVDLVNDCKKEVAEDPNVGQSHFTLYKTAYLRAKYENRRDYLAGKVDLESAKKANLGKAVQGLFDGGKSDGGMGKVA